MSRHGPIGTNNSLDFVDIALTNASGLHRLAAARIGHTADAKAILGTGAVTTTP